MSQVDRPEVAPKPEPFLTLEIVEGDEGTQVKCNELPVEISQFGPVKKETVIEAMYGAINYVASQYLHRYEAGTLSEHVSPEQIEIAKRVIEAKKQGITVADLIKPEESSSVDISNGIDQA